MHLARFQQLASCIPGTMKPDEADGKLMHLLALCNSRQEDASSDDSEELQVGADAAAAAAEKRAVADQR